jgi:hypothetical protein
LRKDCDERLSGMLQLEKRNKQVVLEKAKAFLNKVMEHSEKKEF